MDGIIQPAALLTINSIVMPTPTKYSVPMFDMDSSDSSHSESGVYIRNRIRQGICRIELAWLVNGEDTSKILNAIQPDKVQVTYFDPRTGTHSSAEMLVEDRSCNLVSYKSAGDSNLNMWEIAFNLVQY